MGRGGSQVKPRHGPRRAVTAADSGGALRCGGAGDGRRPPRAAADFRMREGFIQAKHNMVGAINSCKLILNVWYTIKKNGELFQLFLISMHPGGKITVFLMSK
jgi:hypothetical protein